MSKPHRPMKPLPGMLNESAEVNVFNLLFYSRVYRVITVGAMMNKKELRDALHVALRWMQATLGEMEPLEAHALMKTFEQIAADSIGYDLDEV